MPAMPVPTTAIFKPDFALRLLTSLIVPTNPCLNNNNDA